MNEIGKVEEPKKRKVKGGVEQSYLNEDAKPPHSVDLIKKG